MAPGLAVGALSALLALLPGPGNGCGDSLAAYYLEFGRIYEPIVGTRDFVREFGCRLCLEANHPLVLAIEVESERARSGTFDPGAASFELVDLSLRTTFIDRAGGVRIYPDGPCRGETPARFDDCDARFEDRVLDTEPFYGLVRAIAAEAERQGCDAIDHHFGTSEEEP